MARKMSLVFSVGIGTYQIIDGKFVEVATETQIENGEMIVLIARQALDKWWINRLFVDSLGNTIALKESFNTRQLNMASILGRDVKLVDCYDASFVVPSSELANYMTALSEEIERTMDYWDDILAVIEGGENPAIVKAIEKIVSDHPILFAAVTA